MIRQSLKLGFSSISFHDLAKEIEESANWLASYGLDYVRTRVGGYKKHLDEIADYCEAKRINELLSRHDLQSIANSVYEANELVCIYRGLTKITNTDLPEKLRDFIKGPKSYIQENTVSSSNLGRNIAFELDIAAHFALAGLMPDFGDKADLKVHIEERTLFLECKRPQYKHQIHSNIKGAMRQLESRYKTATDPSNCCGLIALSISKIVNPQFQPLYPATAEFLDGMLNNIMNGFIQAHQSEWRDLKDPRTIGVILHCSIPSVIQSRDLLTIGTQLVVVYNAGSPNKDFAIRIAKTLRDRATIS